MDMINITLGFTALAAPVRVVRAIPVLNDLYMAGKDIYVNLPNVSAVHFDALVKIVSGGVLRPFTDLNSHTTVLGLIELASALGVSRRFVLDGFAGWTSHFKWRDLEHAEYLYLLHLEMADLVNFPKYFAGGVANVAMMPVIAEFTRERKPAEYINCLAMFQRLDFLDGFDGTGGKVRPQIQALDAARRELTETFVINPYEHGEFFAYDPRVGGAWSCDGISVYKRPAVGDNLIASLDEFTERFNKFTRGFLNKSPSGDATLVFPHDNVVLAGGSITKMISAEYNEKLVRSSDLDIFVIGKNNDEKDAAVLALLKWFNSPNTYYATVGSVTSVYIVDVPRVFQIISNTAKTPFEVVDRFDMTHIGWYYYQGNLRATAQTCLAMRHKLAQFTNIGRLSQDRVIKTLYNGYDIEKDAKVLSETLDLTEILRDPTCATITGTIKTFQAWYYPRSDPMLDEDEQHAHLCAEIESKSRAQVVSADYTVCKAAMIINGNFESYAAPPFSGFDLKQVVVVAALKNKREIPMATKLGGVRLSSDHLKVIRINSDDDGITIVLSPSADFAAFIRRIEDEVYPKYHNNRVNARAITDSGELTYNISKTRIDNQARCGKSMLKDARGEYRNIEEEIKPGDNLTMTFTVRIHNRRWDDAGFHIKLMISTFTSYSLEPLNATADDVDKIPVADEFTVAYVDDYDASPQASPRSLYASPQSPRSLHASPQSPRSPRG